MTELLQQWSEGKPHVVDQLFDLVYPQLRRIAGALFRGERPENVLQPTSVVNELFLKLIRQRSLRFEDREHFYPAGSRFAHARKAAQFRIPKPLSPSNFISIAWNICI